jgi:UDP-N-acetyl-D-mannosaminuronic acid transferase (WecB/TagA/CpsF family)
MVNFFAGIPFSTEDIKGISKLTFARIVTVNNEYIFNYHTDIDFKNTLKDAVFVCDGRIPFLYSKNVLKKYIVNITGIDLIKFVYESGQFKSVLFIGDTDETNFEIVDYFNKAGFRATGWNPFIDELIDLKLNDDFFKYDAIFVALGCKKQEKFIDYFKNDMQKNGVQIVAGIGGAYSIFLKKKALPSFIYNAGVGSIWRLFQEFKWFRIIRLTYSLKALKYYLK